MNHYKPIHKDGSFDGYKGLKLYYETWLGKPSKAIIVVTPGFAEHSGRYVHLSEYFSSQEYGVYVINTRGHGKSEGERAFVNSFDDFVEDLKIFIEKIKKWEKVERIFLLGHSMGGTIVLAYALKHPEDLKGLITSGAGLAIHRRLGMAVKIASKIAPKMKAQMKIDPNTLTHDPIMVKKYVEDPLVFKFTTTRLIEQIFSTARRLMREAHKLQVPILMLHGESDKLVSAQGSKTFFENVQEKDKKLITYPGLYHEIFNEPEYKRIFDDIIDWIEVYNRG